MTQPHPGLPVLQERIFLRYPEEPTRRIGVRVERWNFEEAETAPGRPVVVLVHGFKGFMDWGFFPYLSLRFAAAGFVVVSMNGSGCGVGDNPLEMDDDEAFFLDTYTRQLEDIAYVREYARGLAGVRGTKEVLFGHSRGGGMAVIAAAEDPPTAIVTWAAIDNADRFGDEAKAKWREDGVLLVPNGRTGQLHRMGIGALDDLRDHRERLDIVGAAGRLSIPLLAVHGTADATVHPAAAHRIAESAERGEVLLVGGADHAMGAKHPLGSPEEIRTLQSAIEGTLAFALKQVSG